MTELDSAPTGVRRRLGRSALRLHPFTLGTMRLHEAHLPPHHWADLFAALIDIGSPSLHSSIEYDSFPLFVETLALLDPQARAQLHHVVKLAEPDFGTFTFDPRRVRSRITEYLQLLGAERIDVVQWMVRGDTGNTEARQGVLSDPSGEIAACFGRLRSEGLILSVVVFPYDHADVVTTENMTWCDGWALYVNAVEQAWLDSLDLAERDGKGVVALRSFGAGRAVPVMRAVLDHQGAPSRDSGGACIELPLLHPAVATTVASVSSESRLRSAVQAASVASDRDRFRLLMDAAAAVGDPESR